MPLEKDILITQLRAIDPYNDDIIEKMVDAIDTYIKGAKITINSGIPVSTTGTAAAQTGTTTEPAIATIE